MCIRPESNSSSHCFISGLNIRNILCVLEPYNGTCKNTPGYQTCLTRDNASCINETVFSIHVNVSQSWNGTSIYCQFLYSTSNHINVLVKGMLKKSKSKKYIFDSGIALLLSQVVILQLTIGPPKSILWV